MWCYYFVALLSCLVLTNANFKGKPRPSYIVPCSKSTPDLNACALEHGRKVIPIIIKGDKKYKIPVLSPLQLDRVDVRAGNLKLILTNITIYGIEKLILKDIKADLDSQHIELVLEGDGLRLISNYKVSGQILVLPISGEGKADFKFDGANFKYVVDYNLITKSDEKKYGVIKDADIKFTIKKAKFHLDNLFNGNKELGENMNKVLNENFEAVLEDLGGAISEVIQSVASGIITGFFSSIPYDELLLP